MHKYTLIRIFIRNKSTCSEGQQSYAYYNYAFSNVQYFEAKIEYVVTI